MKYGGRSTTKEKDVRLEMLWHEEISRHTEMQG